MMQDALESVDVKQEKDVRSESEGEAQFMPFISTTKRIGTVTIAGGRTLAIVTSCSSAPVVTSRVSAPSNASGPSTHRRSAHHVVAPVIPRPAVTRSTATNNKVVRSRRASLAAFRTFVDHADQAALRAKYADDANVPAEQIVPVDAVWGERTLAECFPGETFDYVIASHVIEHVPDVIGWLADRSLRVRAAKAMRPDGGTLLRRLDGERWVDFLSCGPDDALGAHGFSPDGDSLFVAGGFVIMNFIVDLCYAVLDPRIRHGHA